MKSRAVVLTGDRSLEMVEFPVPDTLGEDEALLAVEANGMCGSDWAQYEGALTKYAPYPVVPGHETIGRIERIGERVAEQWGLSEGARVAVESAVPCRRCSSCRAGRWLSCTQAQIYGFTTTTNEPSLSGGYAEYMVLRPNTMVYPLPEHLSTEDAVFFNPLGAGFDWAVRAAGTQVGETIVIMGPGQRGLASVIAARVAGAARIIVGGRGLRPWKLELASALGATHIVNTDQDSIVDVVREITDGAMADRAVDTTPTAIQPMLDAVNVLRPEGTLVLAGMKHGAGIPDVDSNIIIKALTVRGVAMASAWGKEQAIRTLDSGSVDLSRLHTHTVSLDDLDWAMRILGGEIAGEEAMHITVTPH
jgi:threonine dehydrogenase-like Zn-dependent dehydrogenase